MIKQLPKKFNRRLGVDVVHFRHIDVVHKYDELFTQWRSINT